MIKKIFHFTMVIVISLFVLSGCGVIDPNVSFNSLKELQAVIPADFYFFEFNNQTQEEKRCQAITNTQSYVRRKRGDFKFIGYSIDYAISINDDFVYELNIMAILDKSLDKVVEYVSKYTEDAEMDNIVVGEIDCLLINHLNEARLYFIIDNVRYCFEKEQYSLEIEKFLSICEIAVNSKYKLAL